MLSIIGPALQVFLKLFSVFVKTPEAKAEQLRLTKKLLQSIDDFGRIIGNPERKPGDTSDIEDFFRRN